MFVEISITFFVGVSRAAPVEDKVSLHPSLLWTSTCLALFVLGTGCSLCFVLEIRYFLSRSYVVLFLHA